MDRHVRTIARPRSEKISAFSVGQDQVHKDGDEPLGFVPPSILPDMMFEHWGESGLGALKWSLVVSQQVAELRDWTEEEAQAVDILTGVLKVSKGTVCGGGRFGFFRFRGVVTRTVFVFLTFANLNKRTSHGRFIDPRGKSLFFLVRFVDIYIYNEPPPNKRFISPVMSKRSSRPTCPSSRPPSRKPL